MRYPIAIVPLWRWLFVLFGYSADRAYVELTAAELHLRFGTADEHIPLTEIAQIARRRWPLHYGYGAKYGPNGGVSAASPGTARASQLANESPAMQPMMLRYRGRRAMRNLPLGTFPGQ